MKVNIELPFFPGFYESDLMNSDTAYWAIKEELEYYDATPFCIFLTAVSSKAVAMESPRDFPILAPAPLTSTPPSCAAMVFVAPLSDGMRVRYALASSVAMPSPPVFWDAKFVGYLVRVSAPAHPVDARCVGGRPHHARRDLGATERDALQVVVEARQQVRLVAPLRRLVVRTAQAAVRRELEHEHGGVARAVRRAHVVDIEAVELLEVGAQLVRVQG